jgi:hypothetical protein
MPCSVVVGYQSFGPQHYTASQHRGEDEADAVHSATQHDGSNPFEHDMCFTGGIYA